MIAVAIAVVALGAVLLGVGVFAWLQRRALDTAQRPELLPAPPKQLPPGGSR